MHFSLLKKTIFCVFFTVILIVAATLSFPIQAETNTSGECVVLYQPDTETFVYSKNANARRPMASTTKIMTALVAIENSDLSDIVTVTRDSVGIEGTSVGLREGERMTMKDLLYLMMLESANDAASAIAIHIGGSVSEFADMMNKRAASLSMKDSSFKNPHGLPQSEHYTSAEDLALLAAEALNNDVFAEIVSTKSITIPLHDRQTNYTANNHNKLLSMYDYAIGVKTGFTKKSGRCLVGAARRDGVTLICVTLNAPDDWNDHKNLFDYGFEAFSRIRLAEAEEFSYEIPVLDGIDEKVRCTNANELSIILPKGADDIEKSVYVNRFLVAPIEREQEVGKVTFRSNGKVVATLPIIATKDIFSINTN